MSKKSGSFWDKIVPGSGRKAAHQKDEPDIIPPADAIDWIDVNADRASLSPDEFEQKYGVPPEQADELILGDTGADADLGYGPGGPNTSAKTDKMEDQGTAKGRGTSRGRGD